MQIILILFVISIVSSKAKIHQVQILFRHGDRSPMGPFSFNLYEQNKWKYGFGQLTDVGIRQHYELGKWLRRRYSKLLGNNYNFTSIYARSSNIDRTLMSAESNLAGLFENITNEVIPGLRWRPFPVHTVRKDEDFILEKDYCKGFNKMVDEVYKENRYKNEIKKYDNLFKLLSSKLNETINMDNFWKFFDTTFCDVAHNFTIDTWITKSVFNQMNDLNEITWKAMFEGDLSRIGGGLFLKKLVDHMKFHIPKYSKEKQKNNESILNQASLLLYFGHDTDVGSLGRLLIGDYTNNYANIKTWQPPYASAFILELHKDTDWSVKLFYKPGPPTIPSDNDDINIPAIKIEGCPQDNCPFDKFIDIIKTKTITMEEYNRVCKNNSNHSVTDNIRLIFIVFIVTIIIIVCLFSIYRVMLVLWKKHSMKFGRHYTHLSRGDNIN